MPVWRTETCLYYKNSNTTPLKDINILFDKGPQTIKFSSGIKWDILKKMMSEVKEQG